jgi:ubiquitin C-terminal hydrolase
MRGFGINIDDKISLLKMIIVLHNEQTLTPETLWNFIYERRDRWLQYMGSIEACDELFTFLLSLEELHGKNSNISQFQLKQLSEITEIAKKAMVIFSQISWSKGDS